MCYVSINNIQESMERKNRKAHGQLICVQFMIAREHNIGNEDKQGISTTAQDVFEQK